MNVLRNTWYAFGFPDELTTGFLTRVVAGEPIVAYRLPDGTLAALQDRCAHRFVPLSMGRLVGDAIECAYHGLRYGPDGACVHSPVERTPIPRNARVRSYPIVERYGVLWVWLGERERADPASLPDFAFLEDKRRGNVGGTMHANANYELVIDNLADLTHIQYVHGEFQASEAFPRLTHAMRQDGDSVFKTLTLPAGQAPAIYHPGLPRADMLVDLTFEARWSPPSLVRLVISATPAGEPGPRLFEINSAHLVTPETATTCHYFYVNSRDHRVGDPEVDQQIREWQRIGFGQQDKPMLEAQQRSIGEADVMSLRPVLLPTDAGAIRARRVLAAKIAAEAAPCST